MVDIELKRQLLMLTFLNILKNGESRYTYDYMVNSTIMIYRFHIVLGLKFYASTRKKASHFFKRHVETSYSVVE